MTEISSSFLIIKDKKGYSKDNENDKIKMLTYLQLCRQNYFWKEKFLKKKCICYNTLFSLNQQWNQESIAQTWTQ